MLSVSAEFDASTTERILAAIMILPPPMRPTSFGDDEKDPARRWLIEDQAAFSAFFKNRDSGFFLFGPLFDCMFVINENSPSRVWCDVAGDATTARFLLHAIATATPLFGFACEYEERLGWNRVVTKQGGNTIESWVGRDIRRYIPGLYWMTFLSSSLLARHGVSSNILVDAALEHVEIIDGSFLFRFYERPEDWRTASALDHIRATTPGLFDVEKVRARMKAAKTFLDLVEATKGFE